MIVKVGSNVRICQTGEGSFFGLVVLDEAAKKVFGPYKELDELIAVLKDWLTREVDQLRVEQIRNAP